MKPVLQLGAKVNDLYNANKDNLGTKHPADIKAGKLLPILNQQARHKNKRNRNKPFVLITQLIRYAKWLHPALKYVPVEPVFHSHCV